ncbi:UNVERIFIED_CONTAM: hypothetical protein Slati_2701400 [Sesamum latifolium]|uniref:Retrotransposon gag domain-containing protein n=1 Tax=Sesamum latifolium TaxID=2727402 RepID=A0AAW2VXN1_9LAMI
MENPNHPSDKKKAVATPSGTQALQAEDEKTLCQNLRRSPMWLARFEHLQKKDNEPLKEYLQRFNAAALEVPSATQEVKASAFSQGLLDGDFFKSLAKKPVSKFDALLARAAKYINMEDAQAAKKESRGEKWKEIKEETPSKKPRIDTRDKKPPFQRVNAVYTPLTVPITQAFMAVEEKGLLTRPRSWRDTPQRPKNTYAGRKLGAQDPIRKERETKPREIRASSPERSPKEKAPREMTTTFPEKELYRLWRIPPYPVRRAERSGPRTAHNDALVITAILAGYEVGRIFIDSGSSADILFGEANYPEDLYDKISSSGRALCVQRNLGKTHSHDFPSSNFYLSHEDQIPHPGGVEEVQGDLLQSRKCYVEAVRKGQKRNMDEDHQEVPSSKKGKETVAEGALKEIETPAKQPTEELLNIEVVPGSPDKTTRISSHLREETKEEIIACL